MGVVQNDGDADVAADAEASQLPPAAAATASAAGRDCHFIDTCKSRLRSVRGRPDCTARL